MTTAEEVLRIARAEIGYAEARDGSNKYGAFYGMDRVAWCAQFQWWLFNQAGASNLIPKTAYTPTFYGWFQKAGLSGPAPRPGALVFFDWPPKSRIEHVGIVEAVNRDGSITTIEGNTSGPSNANGGCVQRRVRSVSAVVGYGYPRYSNAAPAPVVPPTPTALLTLSRGMMNNPAVANLQRWLNSQPWRPALPVLPPTGNYLDQTVAVVKGAQAQCGVTGSDADGTIVGPKTNAAFAARGYK